VIISWTIVKALEFEKSPIYLGILAGAYAMIQPLVVLSTKLDPNFVLTSYPETFTLVVYELWFALFESNSVL
jgi:hypothetical protein